MAKSDHKKSDQMIGARSVLALALGIAPGAGVCCAVCGTSPFNSAGPVARVIGSNFTDFDFLADPAAPEVCAGCVRLMAGRPGDNPPPLRTQSILVSLVEPQLHLLDMPSWWALISGAEILPGDGCVLSWATSRKRHHWLRAGVSTPERWQAGSDDGVIDWRPDPNLAAAVKIARDVGASKGAILAGRYPPRLHADHRNQIAEAERVLAAYRGSLILDLAVWAAPKVEAISQPEEQAMIDPIDSLAAGLVAELVWGSSMRAEQGKEFWSGYLLRRLRRFARMPLADFISRVAGECAVSAGSAAAAAGLFANMDADTTAAVERAIRERTDLIHALAFDRIQGIRAERRQETIL